MNSILTEEKNNVLVVTLNRPEKLNCFNREMALQLISVLDKAEKELNYHPHSFIESLEIIKNQLKNN